MPTRRRILLVEDDPDLREALADTLETAGYEVVTAPNGEDGLREMHIVRPDAVVLDLVMPQMDGWQFRFAQKHDPMLSSTPVIAISASHSAMAATMDADLYLEKPFEPDAITGAIETVLRMRARRAELVSSAQAERLIALGTLAAGVAHEINNPLTYVLLNLSGALRHLAKIDSEPHRATIERIDRLLRDATEGGERIRGIVQGIRLFSNAEGRAAVPVDVRQCLDAAARLVMNDLRMRAHLVTRYETVPLVLADEARLGQVFLNLLSNAIQAVPDGDPSEQEIAIATGTDEQGRAVIEISDTGAGIPAHMHARIFEPFFTTKPIGQGTGLGLSISHGIVTSLGGEIAVDSEVGKGSRFTVAIPAMTAASLAAVEAAPAPRADPARLRILVVDDEPAVCAALAGELGADHDVVEATSARDALDRLSANQGYDVLLCDVQMPGMSGVELFRCVRSVWPELHARVIFMSGGALAPETQTMLATAGVPVLAKPFAMERLQQLLASVTPAGN